MRHNFKLKSNVWHTPDIEFDIDIETGKIGGKHAVLVSGIVAAALKDGSIVGHPHPTVYEVKDPLHNLSELAAILSQYWMLDEMLHKAMPRGGEEPNDTFTDANGNEIVIAPLY